MLDTAYYERAAEDLADEILMAASEPPARLDMVDWVQENVRVPDGPRAGLRWDMDMTPFWREVLELLSPENPATRISVRKSAQVGFTMILIAWGLAILSVIRRGSLFVFPTLPFARDFSSEKFEPALDLCPEAAKATEPVKSKSQGGSTTLRKKVQNISLRFTGANSTVDLRSKTVPLIGIDEIDEIPRDLNNQGDAMRMIDARQDAFRKTGDYKKLEGGTPTVKGSCRIDDCYEAGDQRLYLVPCPECGHEQALEWERLEYEESYPHKARYLCSSGNGCWITYDQQPSMVKKGRWVAQKPGPGRHPSFAINALYSPFVSWDDIAADYLSCKDDPLQLMSFYNLKLGRSFELKGTAPGWKDLQDRAERIKSHKRGEVPDWALFLSAGTDVQANRLEVSIYGWGIGKSRVLVNKLVLEGDTNDLKVWAQLTEVWQAEYRTLGGHPRFIEMMAVDAGYRPDMVYNWVRGKEDSIRGRPRAMAVKGANRQTNWILGGASKTSFDRPGETKRGTVMLWAVGSYIGKSSWYSFLSLQGPNEAGQFPPGFIHIPWDMPEDWYQQATSEQLKPVEKRGGRVDYEWHLPSGKRNEDLDCAVYAHAAAIRLGMDTLTPQQWAALYEERTQAKPEAGQMDLLAAVVAPAAKEDDKPKETKSIASRLA